MSFAELGLPEIIVGSATQSGYDQATPIQAQAIPILIAGHDLVGCSKTGSGKTAAFAMPLLAKVDLANRSPQVLVLTPTRELAVQVAAAFERYGAGLKDLRVVAIYGGAAYQPQLTALRRGAHVIVGTPGRLIDHVKQAAISLAGIHSLVLDEADEMLRMGFIDDVKWVLEQIPAERQIALFSATMPEPIREIARQNLRDPKSITVDSSNKGTTTIRQEHVVVSPKHKVEVLCRLLEVETTDGVIVFVKTKLGTVEVADKLVARGFNAAALNGDIAQTQRQRTVDKLKAGEIDILVATDVAARGLDVERVSHVFNYDLPHDQEAYVHRIGRTGRAGREGAAILLVTPHQRRVVRSIEKATGHAIPWREQPPVDVINAARAERFMTRISAAMESRQLSTMTSLVEQYVAKTGLDPAQVAAALAVMAVGDRRFFARPLDEPSFAPQPAHKGCFKGPGTASPDGQRPPARTPRPPRERDMPRREELDPVRQAREPMEAPKPRKRDRASDGGDRFASPKVRYKVQVGKVHGVQTGQLVGAIANQTGLSGPEIGKVRIFDQFSVIELPVGMPPAIFETLSKTWVAGRQLRLIEDHGPRQGEFPQRGDKPHDGFVPRPGRPFIKGKKRFERNQDSRPPAAGPGKAKFRKPKKFSGPSPAHGGKKPAH